MVRYRSLAAATAAFLVLAPAIVGIAALLYTVLGGEYESIWIGVAVCVALVLFGLVVRRDARRGDDESTDVWTLIPSWQYEGRHVESGGLSRDEQEAALADVDEQADAHEGGAR